MDLKVLPLVGCLLAFVLIPALAALAVLNQLKFGKLPESERLKRVQRSPTTGWGQGFYPRPCGPGYHCQPSLRRAV